MSPRPIIIDTDPGQDDAIGILLALASPEEINVLGIVTVAGNVPLELTSKNARKLCELANKPKTKVFAGCSRPLIRPLVTAEHVHGKSGLDTDGDPIIVDGNHRIQNLHAVDFIIKTCKDSDEPI